MRVLALQTMAIMVASGGALAQEAGKPATPPATGTEAVAGPDPLSDAGEKAWSFSLSATTYLVPDDGDYVQPTVTADRDWLHLEARYNYEALNAASAWVGYNFSGGEELAWEITPMLGAVFGDLSGIAPGYKGSLTWGKLELYSEGEYVFDTGDSSGSFFYNWSELTVTPVDWLRFGLVTQRTRAYESERDIQRGLLVGVSWKSLDVTGYLFNPDDDDPTFVLGVGLSF